MSAPVVATADLSLEWNYGARDAIGDQRLVARGTKAAMSAAFGKLPVLVDIGRKFFVFRAEQRPLAPAKLADGRYEAQYSGTWIERGA